MTVRKNKKRRGGRVIFCIGAVGILLFVLLRAAVPQDLLEGEPIPAGPSQEEMLQTIADNPDQYPAQLAALAQRNPETISFVYRYPQREQEPGPASFQVKKGEVPLLLQWDGRWGYRTYGDDFMALTGCGPTCLSMAYMGLTGDGSKTPDVIADFSQERGYFVAGAGTSWTLMSEGAKELGLKVEQVPLWETRMKDLVNDGKILICSMAPGDFTLVGHFIVVCGYKDGGFVIRDPNSEIKSGQIWRYEKIKNQIRNIWAFSL